jgi:hypothetical protein
MLTRVEGLSAGRSVAACLRRSERKLLDRCRSKQRKSRYLESPCRQWDTSGLFQQLRLLSNDFLYPKMWGTKKLLGIITEMAEMVDV